MASIESAFPIFIAGVFESSGQVDMHIRDFPPQSFA
jgi:hypothetical protein